MAASRKIAVPNALLLIADRRAGTKVPAAMGGQLFASTPSCIAVGCMADCNGETEIMLGVAGDAVPGVPPSFVGRLETPSGGVAVWNVRREKLLEKPVQRARTRVRIWVNHPSEPDRVKIILD